MPDLQPILHVDADPDIRLIVSLSLQLDPQFEVRGAASANEALDVLKAGWRPRLVVLDHVIPGMDGIALTRAIRAIADCAALPVVFLTAQVTATTQALLATVENAAVLTKPFDPTALAGQVRRATGLARPPRG